MIRCNVKSVQVTRKNRSKLNSANREYKQATEATQSSHADAIERLSSDRYDSGTYDIATLSPVVYKSGYQVTFCQIGDNYTPVEYAQRVNEFLNISSDGKTLAGKFEGTPEISFHTNDLKTAIRLAKKYNQISIWDWRADIDIKTGGTGRRKS